MSLGPGGRRYLRLRGEVPIVATPPPGQDPDDPARVSFPTYDGDVDDAVDADADDGDAGGDADDADEEAVATPQLNTMTFRPFRIFMAVGLL